MEYEITEEMVDKYLLGLNFVSGQLGHPGCRDGARRAMKSAFAALSLSPIADHLAAAKTEIICLKAQLDEARGAIDFEGMEVNRLKTDMLRLREELAARPWPTYLHPDTFVPEVMPRDAYMAIGDELAKEKPIVLQKGPTVLDGAVLGRMSRLGLPTR